MPKDFSQEAEEIEILIRHTMLRQGWRKSISALRKGIQVGLKGAYLQGKLDQLQEQMDEDEEEGEA